MSDLVFFNSSDGFSEAFLRGLRKTILSESNYGILSGTHNLRDLKTVIIKFHFFNRNLKGKNLKFFYYSSLCFILYLIILNQIA